MSKREQALKIEPKNEMHFKGPYTKVVTEYFQLTNPADRPIAFKVKTTAPKRYCVRPNNGTIAPGKTVGVAVMLQPLASGEQPTAAEKSKHKFMIQSVFVATENGNADDLFKSVDASEIMDSKFRCVFDDTNSGPATSASAPLTGGSSKHGSDSDNDIQGGGDKGGANDPSGDYSTKYGSIADYHHHQDVSSSVSSAPGPDSSLVNGAGDDDHYGGGSYSSATTTSTAGGGATVVESSAISPDAIKRILDENRDLKLKLQEAERRAYNRFSGQQAQAQQKSSSAQLQQQQPASLLDQPLSGQVILTVLVSLLIGFILGKLDLGLF